MEREKLSRYFWLNHEIERQERRRERLLKKISSGDHATDIVTGSSAHFPYIETKFKITGLPVGALRELDDAIEKNVEESLSLRIEIEKFINGVSDPQMRELLRTRFIDCQGWREVGKENFISTDHARKKIREFLKQIS